jgi:hypothetical protein
MGMQQLVLKFAYLFRSKITDVKNFRVLDAKLTSDTILLVWDPVIGVDTEFYTLYYSPDLSVKTTLGSQAPKDVDVSSLGITALELPTDEYSVTQADVKIDSLLTPSWDFDSGERRYAVETVTSDVASEPLEPGVLYFSRPDKKYFYFLPDMENDKDYFFAITGTDSFGEKSPSFNAPVEQQVSKDDIPPSLAKIEDAKVEGDNLVLEVGQVTNIDGSALDPSLFKGFTLYCFVDESNLDLSSRYRFYPEKQESLEGGRTRLYVPISDINEVNCYTERNPSSVMLVVAGAKQGTVEDYRGPITPGVLSSPITIR